MTLSELIKQYRTEHDLSQRAFAARSDLSNGYISMVEKGENPATGEPITPTLVALKKIASGMGLTLGALIAKCDDIPVDLSGTLPDNVIPMPNTRRVPRVGAIACGTPILAEQNIEDYDEVPDWVKCDYTLVCKGDSMIGARIHDGDIVCIKQADEVENGQIAAVMVDGEEATLKRVRFQDGSIVLWPENPAYAPMVFS